MGIVSDGKNKSRILIVAVILAASLMQICVSDISSLDELWDYNFSRMITMGMLPYRDYNMVPTPLFTLVMSLPLFVHCSLLVYRVMCSLLIAVLFCVYYHLLSRGMDNSLTALPLVLIGILMVDYVSYNNMFFMLILTVCCLFYEGEYRKYSFMLGIICALSVFLRQTSGCVLLLVSFVIIMMFYEDKIKNAVRFAAGAAIPCLAFFIYFVATSSLSEFWDYCLLGLVKFGSGNNRLLPNAYVFLTLFGAELAADLYLLIRYKRRSDIVQLMLGFSVLTICIPIVDYSHVQFAVLFYLIPFYRKMAADYSSKVSKTTVVALSAVVLMALGGFRVWRVYEKPVIKDSGELNNIPIEETLLNDYSNLAMIVKDLESDGYDVTFFSSSSVLVSIINGEANPPYDTFNKGNFPGSVSNHMLYVEEACDGIDKIVIIASDYDEEGWQNPDGVLEYVRSNCVYIDSYGRFLIYRGI